MSAMSQALRYRGQRPRWVRTSDLRGTRLPDLIVGLGVAVIVLGVCLYGGESLIVRAIEVLIAVLLIGFCAARPFGSLAVLLVYVPLQLDFLPYLLRLGAPVPVVRALGGAKEILVAAIAVAALRTMRRPRRLDALDKLALGYIAVVSVYLVAPYFVPGSLATVSLSVRLLAWRADAIWVVLFLGCRHVAMRPGSWRRLGSLVLALGALAGGVAVYESFAPTTWLHFLTNVIDVPHYQAVVFQHATTPDSLVTRSSVGGHSFVRVGSVIQSPLALGFYLCVALAIGLERLTHSRLRAWSAIATLLSAAGIVVTLTRSALLAGLAVILVVFWQGVRGLSPGRVRLGLILVGLLVLVAPFAGSSAVGQRTAASASGGQDASEHVSAVRTGFDALLAQPFGRGLGTAPSIGRRFEVRGTLTSEDAYLQVGNELGIIAMVLFVLLMLSLVSHLRRAPPNGVISPNALCAAGWGLILGGFFLHVWLNFPTALTFWGVAGVALNQSLQDTLRPGVGPGATAATRRTRTAAGALPAARI